jgi:hypothetical protein
MTHKEDTPRTQAKFVVRLIVTRNGREETTEVDYDTENPPSMIVDIIPVAHPNPHLEGRAYWLRVDAVKGNLKLK